MIPEFRTGDLVSYIYYDIIGPFSRDKEYNDEEVVEVEEPSLVLGFFDGDDGAELSDIYSAHDCVVYARILGPLGEKTVLLTELTMLSRARTINE